MSSDSEEDDFVTYGTPLEPLEEDAIPKKRTIGVEDQVAKDKYGRRRFHGAFTGGFSAGFFNSVGSLEGWKPAQFKSSRSSKAQSQAQTAEDFMDDEDMDEFGIAPKMIRTTGDYNLGKDGPNRKRTQMHFSEGPIPGIPVLKTLEPVRETIGIKLLMKMGWKPGQGVGPRLSKKEKSESKKSQKETKVYGCSLPGQGNQSKTSGEVSEDSGSDEDIYENVLFAPSDFQAFLVKPKTDCFGLGYSGLDRRPVLSSHIDFFTPVGPSLVMQEKKKKVSIRGHAFGVGAFERDDEDIYAKEDMSQYDFALDTPQMLAEKRKQEKNSKQAKSSPSGEVLEGFTLSSTTSTRKVYPPPSLPPGFSPLHHTRQSRFSAATATKPSVTSTTKLSANERAVLVNEPCQPVKPSEEELKPLAVERTTSGVFRPFVADPEKQERYEKYLTLCKTGESDKLKNLQPFTMTEWERERERGEFEQAARLYRPLSAAFSDRFVSASQPDSETDPLAPVARSATADNSVQDAARLKMYGRLTRRVTEWLPHSILCKRFNIPQPGVSSSSLQTKATRPKFSVFNFLDAAPFNAPATEESSTTDITMEETEKPKTVVIPAAETSSGTSTANQSTAIEDPKTSKDNISVEQLTDSTNKMDLYKAIFLSSSDEEEEEDSDKIATSTTQLQPSNQSSAKDMNVLRNTSPPRGIFANLDFEKLKSHEQSSKPKDSTASGSQGLSSSKDIFANSNLAIPNQPVNSKIINKESAAIIIEPFENSTQPKNELTDCDLYGPSLPLSTTKPQVEKKNKEVCVSIESGSSEDDWVEITKSSDSDSDKEYSKSKKKHSKKSHRKSKKHKEKKHKHKKKRK